MIKRAAAILLALWVGLVLPGEAFAYRVQPASTQSDRHGQAMHASEHDGHFADAMSARCDAPAHCPHCRTAGKCPKACARLCASAAPLSLAVDAQPRIHIAALQLPWTFVPADISPPHNSRLLRPPIA